MTRDDVMRETAGHIRLVGRKILDVTGSLQMRAVNHDASKFSEEEFGAFARETPTLRGLTYGSDEYKAALERIRPALEEHYRQNRHHPEHHKDGIHGMNLLDLIEMLADWAAAVERHDDGDLMRSIGLNVERFGYGDEIQGLLARTAKDMGWVPSGKEAALLKAIRRGGKRSTGRRVSRTLRQVFDDQES